MKNDEQAIRKLVDTWLSASKTGDFATVLGLMADDVIFMVPGREPFGKEAFAAMTKEMKDARMEGTSEIQELKILGDWAWMRSRLKVAITLPNGRVVRRSGYALTILYKNADGAWLIARDANLETAETETQSIKSATYFASIEDVGRGPLAGLGILERREHHRRKVRITGADGVGKAGGDVWINAQRTIEMHVALALEKIELSRAKRSGETRGASVAYENCAACTRTKQNNTTFRE